MDSILISSYLNYFDVDGSILTVTVMKELSSTMRVMELERTHGRTETCTRVRYFSQFGCPCEFYDPIFRVSNP